MPQLSAESILRAYSLGIFPMAASRDDPELHWVDPDTRGIMPLDEFHIPRRLRRTVRRGPYEIRFDSAFEKVIRACARPTPERPESWINEEIIRLYCQLYAVGDAHSVECWEAETLVGGLYGVSIAGAFFGESMFADATDASKIALIHLVARLKSSGFVLLDAQFQTDHLAQFGAIEIPRDTYLAHLASALNARAKFYRDPPTSEELEAVLRQSSTQMS